MRQSLLLHEAVDVTLVDLKAVLKLPLGLNSRRQQKEQAT
jgi:hypothetical protein